MIHDRMPFAVRPAVLVGIVLVAFASRVAVADGCASGSFDTTFELIQKAIFENHGCTNDLCHGSDKSGGLDLRPTVAYDNLIDTTATTVAGFKRVIPGDKDDSLLFINLAAKANPAQWTAPLRGMPLDPLPGLSEDELNAVRLWIEKGAPRDGVVDGTATLLNACLPPPEPITINPLPAPAAGTGVQLQMPEWTLAAHSEREVCFASYYDVTDQIPDALRRDDGTFRYKLHETRQEPLSHHMVPILYKGAATITSPSWGAWTCHGGAQDGQSCDPLNTSSCSPDGICASPIGNSVGCLGYGPGDGGIGFDSAGISITQQTAEEFPMAPGVYDSLPTKGIILWSSHAFNLTDEPGTLRAWLNFDFAQPDEQKEPAVQIFDASAVFKTDAPAFKTDEPCNISIFPPKTHLFELSSHTHKRGKRWRTFRGAFRCAGGPKVGQPCDPFGYDLVSVDVCGGSACTSTKRLKVGDCDLSGDVTINELVTGVGIALGSADIERCQEADGNDDATVSVDELISSVNAALNGVPAPVLRDPSESLMYVSLVYNDPVTLRMNPALVLAGDGSSNDERSVTYCSLYDNGYTNPVEVKTRSGSPQPPLAFPGIGGPCAKATNCTKGKVGAECTGVNDAKRNASCDSSDGAGDGLCDACPLKGGVTTEDEMFILLGRYYLP